DEAHHDLADLYSELNYLDMALEHRRQEQQITKRVGRRAGETADDHAHRLELLEREFAMREDLLRQRENQYSSGSRALVGERVQEAGVAWSLGLAQLAADEILSTPGEQLGVIGIKMELELLLTLGRTEEVRARLNDKDVIANKGSLGFEDIPSPSTAAGTP